MTKTKRRLYTILFFLLIIASLFSYKIYDYNTQVQLLNKEIEEEKEILALIEEELIKTTNPSDMDEKRNIYDQLPSTLGFPQIIALIHQTSLNNDVHINSILAEEEENKKQAPNAEIKGYKTTTINITITATNYEKLRNFMEDLYLAERIINLSSFELTVEDNLHIVKMNIEVYHDPAMFDIIPDLKKIDTFPISGRINPSIIWNQGE